VKLERIQRGFGDQRTYEMEDGEDAGKRGGECSAPPFRQMDGVRGRNQGAAARSGCLYNAE
jgi:hypothetical protein